MDFEITTVNDSSGKQRVFIDKTLDELPHIGSAVRNSSYEDYDAAVFRSARDRAFAFMGYGKYKASYRRRFIQNDYFISDTLEMTLPRVPAKDMGYTQYVNLTLLLLKQSPDPSAVPIEQRGDAKEMMTALDALYERNIVSKDSHSYEIAENLIGLSRNFLSDQSAKFIITQQVQTLLFNHNAVTKTSHNQLKYVLGVKQKREKGPG